MIIIKSLREIAVPQGNPAEWVTEVGCGSRQHPGGTRQTPTRSRRNPQKSIEDPDGTGEKVSQNRSKIWSGRVPGASGSGPGTRPSEGSANKSKNVFPKLRNPSLGTGFGTILGPGREPKIDKKRARERKSASGDGAGNGSCRFFLPLPLGVALRTDFWRALTLENCAPTTAGARF